MAFVALSHFSGSPELSASVRPALASRRARGPSTAPMLQKKKAGSLCSCPSSQNLVPRSCLRVPSWDQQGLGKGCASPPLASQPLGTHDFGAGKGGHGRERQQGREGAAGAPCFAARLVGAEVWFPPFCSFPLPRQAPGLPTSKGERAARDGAGVNTGLGPARRWVTEVSSCPDVSPVALGTAVVRLPKEGRLFSCSSAARSRCPSLTYKP